jgi:hypothetical protein
VARSVIDYYCMREDKLCDDCKKLVLERIYSVLETEDINSLFLLMFGKNVKSKEDK